MLNVVRIWILSCTFLTGAGWILSGLHELNQTGYLFSFGIAAFVVIIWQRMTGWKLRQSFKQWMWKNLRRCRRPAPFLFLLLAIMTLISGILYVPYNSDSYSYRLPRILHWLGAQQWHWIHTADPRMNVMACNYEWVATPLVLFTHSDRCLFLVNWIPYLMLPCLVFCALTGLGVRHRVAWWWMWLLASGWCFAMQAASLVNDGFGAVLALAAVVLAVRSLQTGSVADLGISLLAAALMTGVKQSNIPLLVLWLVAAAPGFRTALRRPLALCLAVPVALLVSSVPTVLFNLQHTGTWSGFNVIATEFPDWHVELHSPFWGIIGNVFCLAVQNLLPPFFPLSGAWNHAMDAFLQTRFGAHFESFEHFGALSPGISESSAGIGLAITLLILASLVAARQHPHSSAPIKASKLTRSLQLLPWALVLVFMAKDGEGQNARHLTPYYVFFFPMLLAIAGHGLVVRKLWWQRAALLCMISTAGTLVVSVNRPLFPAVTLFEKLADAHPGSHTLALLNKAYRVHHSLERFQRELVEKLPANEPVIGYAAIGNAETEPALWVPFGSRRVERILQQDTPELLAAHGIHWVVIHDAPSRQCPSIDEWMARYHATLVADLPMQTEMSQKHLIHVYLMQLNRPS